MANLAYPMLYITRKEKGDTQKKLLQNWVLVHNVTS